MNIKNKKQNYRNLDEIPLDNYEEELAEFIEKGEFVNDPNFEENKKMFEEAARRHIELQKSKSITLRIKNLDLIKLKAKAVRNRIPYQTLINLLISSYNDGKTKLSL